MERLCYDEFSARGKTDAFIDYLNDYGINLPMEIENIFYWLSEDDVEEYARVNFDVYFSNEKDEDEEDEEE